MSSSAALVEPAPAAVVVPAVFEGSTLNAGMDAANGNSPAGIMDKGLLPSITTGSTSWRELRDTPPTRSTASKQRSAGSGLSAHGCTHCNSRRTPCHQHSHANHVQVAKDNNNNSTSKSSSASPLHHQHNSGAVPPQSQKEKATNTSTVNSINGNSHTRTISGTHSHSHSNNSPVAGTSTSSAINSNNSDNSRTDWYNISHLRPRRISKIKFRASTASKNDSGGDNSLTNTTTSATTSDQAMEPPVLSFYGTEPVPLPSRFAGIKRNLVAGHEPELEASWRRLLIALRDEAQHIQSHGSNLTPSIDFTDIEKPSKSADFARELRRAGVGVVRGVMPKADCDKNVAETVKYLETKHDFKPPSAQDPTCFDFFWSPAQVRSRAHPSVLRAQKFVMSLWDNQADDRMATKFPIVYADRIRIHGAPSSSIASGTDSAPGSNGNGVNPGGMSTSAAAAAAAASAAELLGDFTSSTVIAQVDNGSLERWEPDGYGRGGTYDAIFKGRWEEYDPWDPSGRIGTTTDAYNGHGACSIFRMYQGVLSLNHIEPGLIRLLPSPKLATAYFLLRPFFSPKTKAPEPRDTEAWEAYLDADNWALDKDQSTIIHGAVPGHAQRLTELWHPHLHLRRTLVTIPTLQPGDYILWHPDLAYHITSNDNFSMASVAASRATTPPPGEGASTTAVAAGANSTSQVSILVYVPAAPLTQTNALYLARQRKTFQRGHPGPDFDATGSGLGTEASHTGRPGETDIAEVGGSAGLQAMGLAPFDVAPSPAEQNGNASPADKSPTEKKKDSDGDVDMEGSKPANGGGDVARDSVTQSHAEADLVRLANIILFPENYYYMPKTNGDITPRVKAEKLQRKR
ncbi:hypothetical protein GE09DRAFT_1074089 [Coniochaeta sp. 2T2.1]|nr:hypothetical protein GE09DRAFT_1074089 [Coniochaeta sp. 2T2.1]